MESTDLNVSAAGLVASVEESRSELSVSANNGTPPSSQNVLVLAAASSIPLVNGNSGDHAPSPNDSNVETAKATPAKKAVAKKTPATSNADGTAKPPPRKRTPNPNAPPRNRSKKPPQQLVQVADLPQQIAASNAANQAQIPILHPSFLNGSAHPGFSFISAPQMQAQLQVQPQIQQSPILRGARTILPKPASGQNVSSVQQIAAAAAFPAPVSQSSAPAPSRPQLTQVFPTNTNNNSAVNSISLQSAPMMINGQQYTFGNQQFIRMPQQTQSSQAPKIEGKPGEAATIPVQLQPNNPQQTMVRGQQQVQAYLQTIQTPNGPMTLAFLPPNVNPVFPGSQPTEQRFQFNQSGGNIALQNNGMQYNGLQNFLNQQNLVLQQTQQQPLPVYPTPPSSLKEESEFNLDEFLTFETPPTTQASSTADGPASQSILEELVSGELFQSTGTQLTNGAAAGDSAQQLGGKTKSKKKPRQRKKSDTSGIQQKVEEILRGYKEEVTVDPVQPAPLIVMPPLVLPSPGITLPPLGTQSLGLPASVSTDSVPLDDVQPVVASPAPLPPPPKPRKKTDLGKKRDKDVQTLESVDLESPFKGKISALHRLLPFHLLSEPDERPENIEREEGAFKLIAEGLVQRRDNLHRRYQNVLLSEAADFVPKVDMIACASTWLDSEREEFEAEKRAVECGMPLRLPPWIYADTTPQTSSSYFDADFFDLMCNNALEEPALPPALLMPPPPAPAVVRPLITVRKSEPQSGKIKLSFKRTLHDMTPSPVEEKNEPPLKKVGKILLKLSRRPENGPDPPAALLPPAAEPLTDPPKIDDLVTQNAVESILFGDKPSSFSSRKADDRGQRHGISVRHHPVMGNGPSFSSSSTTYFYGHNAASEVENEPDSALDEAIQSILG